MQLEATSMNSDSKFLSTIPEANHLEEELEEHGIDINGYDNHIKKTPNKNDSLTNSSSTNRPDRELNLRFHVAALSGNLNLLEELFTKSRIPIDCRDKENSTALLLSCARGHYSCAEYLLKNGADPNARRITGASSLYFASLYHHTRIVELLIKQYKAIVDLSTFDGSTPLHVACERGFTDIVQLLIDAQANINSRMNDGTTAVMLACQNGHLAVVQMLVPKGCNVLIQRLDSITPLYLTVEHGHEMIFDYLIGNVDSFKDTVDLPREDGATPLFKACQKGFTSLVNKILQYKPNLGLLRNGESCLHAATMFNHAPIVRALIDHGANPLLNNWEGMTAVDLAKEAQLTDILDILLKALSSKLTDHGRQFLLHKSTRRTNADFDLELAKAEDSDEWKLYKSLKSAAELERLQEEIQQIPVLPDALPKKGKNLARKTVTTQPNRQHSTPSS